MSSDSLALAHAYKNTACAAGADAALGHSASTVASLEANCSHGGPAVGAGAGGDGGNAARSYLPDYTIHNAQAGEFNRFGSGRTLNVTAPLHSIEVGEENLAVNILNSTEVLGNTFKNKAIQAVDYAKQHPIEGLGYTAGAIVGGTVAGALVPVELTAGAAIGVSLAGAAALDGAIYLLEKAMR